MKAFKLAQTLGTTMIINQALIELLIEKGIMTGQELMDKIEEIKKELRYLLDSTKLSTIY